MTQRTERISVRISEDEKCRLVRASEVLGVDEAVLVRIAVDAVVRATERQGQISLPLEAELKSKPPPPTA